MQYIVSISEKTVLLAISSPKIFRIKKKVVDNTFEVW